MCTVTLVARRTGFLLGMNRDEQRSRVEALPPVERRHDGRRMLHPSEPGAGTWIGVNDAGAAFALVNWYSVPARVESRPVSRGQVVQAALSCGTWAEVDLALQRLPLNQLNPFRLIGIFSDTTEAMEWDWNLATLTRTRHRWKTATWISSGHDEREAQRMRGQWFKKALQQRAAGTLGWLRRLHRSHGMECGPYSHCMHRPDAVTVSYTEIAVTRRAASIRYAPGPPCTAALSPALRLTLRHSPRSGRRAPAAYRQLTGRVPG